eukprot:4889529-Amphidinium_carterae.2
MLKPGQKELYLGARTHGPHGILRGSKQHEPAVQLLNLMLRLILPNTYWSFIGILKHTNAGDLTVAIALNIKLNLDMANSVTFRSRVLHGVRAERETHVTLPRERTNSGH